MSLHGVAQMARDLEKRTKKLSSNAKKGLNVTSELMYERAKFRTPKPEGSPYKWAHPWARGGMLAHIFKKPAKGDRRIVYTEVLAGQPAPDGNIQPGYNIAWEKNDAPYVRHSIKDTMPTFEEEMDKVMEEFTE